jgi:hypothetical protein
LFTKGAHLIFFRYGTHLNASEKKRAFGSEEERKGQNIGKIPIQEKCTWVTIDQPVAIMDSWIQSMHTQDIFHLIASTAVCKRKDGHQRTGSRAGQVKAKQKLSEKKTPKTRQLSGRILYLS